MHTLIINAGSSSVKFRLYATSTSKPTIVMDGVVDRIGTSTGATLEVTTGTKNIPEKNEQSVPIKNHKEAGMLILSLMREYDVALVVHRAVHGGKHTESAKITKELIAELHKLSVLAPLHLPHAIELMELFAEQHVNGIVCFDTMFHANMPLVAKTYPIPQDLANKHNIIRYGFHGIAHEAMAQEAARLEKKNYKQLKIITCQLGNGVSLCAIKGGKSIETSMGFTPLEGVMMGTRSGDIDPAIMPFLLSHEGMNAESCLSMLEEKSGLLAVGGACDVRDLLAKEKSGDANAKLALDLFAHKIRMRIGSYVAILGGVDLVVLGGGIARSHKMRERILIDLDCFGIVLDKKANLQKGLPIKLHKGKTPIYVIDVDEQEHMLKLAKNVK